MNRCERCGKAVPDGLPICPECLKLAGAGKVEISAAEELRDIAAILSIEAGTDANIKEALQGILNIAARLERSVSDGEKEAPVPVNPLIAQMRIIAALERVRGNTPANLQTALQQAQRVAQRVQERKDGQGGGGR